jgi:arylsulfatase A-like enzyme
VQTPALDRLAAEGARFDHAYTPVPVCSPARACLLTGKTASQVGIHDWLQEADETIANRDWLHGEPTLFDRFHAAGYRTALCGKWHLGRSHLPPSGADEHFGLPYWQGTHNEAYTYVHNGEMVNIEGNKTQVITDHALEFIDSTAEPFFLCVGYIATHSPYNRQAHDPALTAQYQDAAFVDIPPYAPHPWVKNEGTANDPDADDLRDRYIGYYAAVTELDKYIGRIVSKLETDGRLENTIIVYTSDHGCAIGHHGFFGKGNSTRPLNMYETSLQVPLIWRGPDVTAGQVIEACVDHYDTFKTILAMAGLSLNADEDEARPGRSYINLLQAQPLVWEDTLYGEYGDLRMIRDARYKLVWRYPDGPHELFDMKNDPDERHNLYGQDSVQAVVDTLKQKLDAFYARYSDDTYSGLRVKSLPQHNLENEAWRDGRREARGLQVY